MSDTNSTTRPDAGMANGKMADGRMADGRTSTEAAARAPGSDLRMPVPVVEPSPLRFAINGVTDKIPDLKGFVAEQEFDPDLKAFIVSELDELETNAATIHLHDVEHPHGGFDLHLSIHGVQLGGRAGAVKSRAQLTGAKE